MLSRKVLGKKSESGAVTPRGGRGSTWIIFCTLGVFLECQIFKRIHFREFCDRRPELLRRQTGSEGRPPETGPGDYACADDAESRLRAPSPVEAGAAPDSRFRTHGESRLVPY